MIAKNCSELEEYVASIMSSGAGNVTGREVASSNELAIRYANKTNNTVPSSKAVANAFIKKGAKAHDKQVRLKTRRKVRL